ncbi:AIPR family protein [Sphingopyxis sp. R3-92]|uniref:AIPR family protein n=1 Tax=Sphingopyxis sp. R3-92 TaxID=3158553 RepID=UPI003EE523F5
MSEPRDQFAEQLAADVDEAVTSPDAATVFSEVMFTQLVLERLEEAGRVEGAFDLFQKGFSGRAEYRIDGYAIDDELGSLELFTTIHTGEVPPRRLTPAEMRTAYERALRFAKASVDGLAAKLEPSNSDASDLARRIEREAANISAIRLTLLTDAIAPPTLPADDMWSNRTVEHAAFDIDRLHRILGEGETRSDISVDLTQLVGGALPCLHLKPDSGAYEAYLTVVPGDLLSRVYQRYGVRLLELNVRAFLGLQGRKSVNSELRRTIVEQPSMFLAFNNGIVATVDDIVLEKDALGRDMIAELRGLQIVNGGQTTASLHRARFKDSVKLDAVEVPMKIIHVTGGDLSEMVSSVSRAANRQNTVQPADFSANDPFHQAVEELANNSWLESGKGRWFYERARGSWLAAEQKASYRASDTRNFRENTPKGRRFSKVDLARWLHAWNGLPNRVCLGGQKNFQYFMQRMKEAPPAAPDDTWFRRVVSIGLLYRASEKLVRQMGFPAFRAPIAAYLVAALGQRTGGRLDFDAVWKKQGISDELEQMLRAWAPEIDRQLRQTAGQRNPGEWFKKEECWKAICDALPSLTDPLPPEISRATAPATAGGDAALGDEPALSVEDFDRISRCMEIDSQLWLKAGEIGQSRRLLNRTAAGICRTLAGYAAGGWEKRPSLKQARYGLEALATVRSAGLLDADEGAEA